MQKATILYNARINDYRKIKELDAELDNKPTKQKVAQIAELRIRNLQAFRELECYNNTGQFYNRHPLVKHYSLQVQLEKLLQNDPPQFLSEYANTRENVKRYKSYCNNAKRKKKKDLHDKDKLNLKKHEEKLALFEQILSKKDEQ